MARVTVEDCTDKIPNRFELVALAGQRAKDITSGVPITVDGDNDKNAVIALREIAAGNMDIPALREELVASLQTKAKVDVVEREENLYAEVQEEVAEEDLTATATEMYVSDSHSDLETDKLYTDNIIDEE